MRKIVFLSALIFAVYCAHVSVAETTSPQPYTLVRWDENYSYLKDPQQRNDIFDPVKYIALGEYSYLSLGGQARYRYEFFNNNNFGAGPQDDDGYNLTRFMLHADLHLGQNFRFFLQGKSAMVDGRTGGPRASDADEADIQQAFGDFILPFADKTSLTLRGGRQEMSYGAQRLIGAGDWTNARRTFEGAKVTLTSPNNVLDVFWVRPVLVDKEELNDGDGNSSFAGIYNTTSLPRFIDGAGSKLESYVLALNRTATSTGGADSDTYTVGARFTTKPKPWDLDVEADWQFGNFASSSIAAYSLAVEGGYTFANVTLSPRAFVGFDIASGSPDAQNRFNPLFPTGHQHFGYIDVIGRQNIIDIHPGVLLKLKKDINLRIEDHTFWRQNDNDAVYNTTGAVLRADNGSDAAYIGNEIDLLLTWQVDRHLYTYLGYSHFFAGEFIEETGAHEDIDFAYAALVYTF